MFFFIVGPFIYGDIEQISEECPYLGKNWKSEGTFFSSAFKVQEENVTILFSFVGLVLRCDHFAGLKKKDLRCFQKMAREVQKQINLYNFFKKFQNL